MPDLVLLDINMPKMDGFAVLREVRADPNISHIPVIVLTANRLDSMDVQTGLNLGADDYVMKPFDRRELMARIQTKLRVKGADDELRRQNRQLNVLVETARVFNSRTDLQNMLTTGLNSVVMGLGVDVGYLFDFEKGVCLMNPVTSPVLDAEQVRDLFNHKKLQEALLVDDVAGDARWSLMSSGTLRSALLIPVLDRDVRLIGALLLMHERPAYFKQEHVSLLRCVANQVAVIIENEQLRAVLAKEPVSR
jgi:CheY-like chemotaxis protein